MKFLSLQSNWEGKGKGEGRGGEGGGGYGGGMGGGGEGGGVLNVQKVEQKGIRCVAVGTF